MTEDEPIIVKTSMPGWARFLVGLFMVTLVGIIVTVVAGSIAIAHLQREGRDPVKINQIATSAMHIQSLPPGFHYTLGYSLFGTDTVTVDTDNQDMSFIFLRIKNARHLKQD